MWQVVTASQNQWSEGFGGGERELPQSEIDELIEALTNLAPQQSESLAASLAASLVHQPRRIEAPPKVTATASPPRPQNLLYFTRKNPVPVNDPVNNEVISVLEIPRSANAPADPQLAPAVREQLLKLRTTILLAAEQRQLRSVLICSADPAETAAASAAPLSQLIAEYQRLKVAYLEVVEEDDCPTNQRKVLPFGYTFHIRRTKLPNRYEIASSLGAVRLEDWLKWWSPTVVLQEMNKLFDLVVISAPSITTHSDVALLAGAVDGVILTATENVTAYASLAEAQQRLEAAQACILGVTLHQQGQTPSAFSSVKACVRALIHTVVKNK